MSLKSLLRDSSFGPENIVCDFAPMLKVMVTKLPAVVALPRAAAEAWDDATAVPTWNEACNDIAARFGCG